MPTPASRAMASSDTAVPSAAVEAAGAAPGSRRRVGGGGGGGGGPRGGPPGVLPSGERGGRRLEQPLAVAVRVGADRRHSGGSSGSATFEISGGSSAYPEYATEEHHDGDPTPRRHSPDRRVRRRPHRLRRDAARAGV